MDVGISFIDFLIQHDVAEVAKNIEKTNGFLSFFTFWLLGCWNDFMVDFWLILDGFWDRKSIKDRSKIDQKSNQKSDAILDRFWMALGSIFDRFWAQVGGQVGAKLAPKSEKWGPQDDVNKHARK